MNSGISSSRNNENDKVVNESLSSERDSRHLKNKFSKTKHSNNLNEQARIYYIIEKKEREKEKNLKCDYEKYERKQSERITEDYFGVRKSKRKRKESEN